MFEIMNTNFIMPLLAKTIYKISPRLGFYLQYFHHRGYFPNLKHPKDFSEVIGSQMVSGEIDKYTEYADKIAVRRHIENWGLKEFLPQVYKIWDDAQDICFDDLPNQFIIKTNHGSGGHIICKDKSLLDIETIRKHFDKVMNTTYNNIMEPQYRAIRPMVYCEEFINDGNAIPTDYKFMCMDGEIKAILLCFDRDADVHKLVYDENWNKCPYIQGASFVNTDYPCPDNFDTMKEIVRTIATKFEQVRIDLYNAYGKIYIGELTFTADGGILRNFTTDAIKAMGRK